MSGPNIAFAQSPQGLAASGHPCGSASRRPRKRGPLRLPQMRPVRPGTELSPGISISILFPNPVVSTSVESPPALGPSKGECGQRDVNPERGSARQEGRKWLKKWRNPARTTPRSELVPEHITMFRIHNILMCGAGRRRAVIGPSRCRWKAGRARVEAEPPTGEDLLDSSVHIRPGIINILPTQTCGRWAWRRQQTCSRGPAEHCICAKPAGIGRKRPSLRVSLRATAQARSPCGCRKCVPLGQKTKAKDIERARFKVESSNPVAQRSRCRSFHPHPNRPIQSSDETSFQFGSAGKLRA